jgi:TolB-like protein
MAESVPGTSPSVRSPEDRLDSWKEIAAYLNRDVTTVQRWEKREGMPVHRHLHDRMGSVYASRTELDAWAGSRNLPSAQENGNNAPLPNLPAEPPRSVISTSLTRWRFVLPLAVAAALLAVAVSLLGLNARGWRDRLFAGPSRPQILALAVLPLNNLSGDPEQEYFADGMTEALITELGKISVPRVISRQSVMQYKGSKKRLSDIARELNVEAVLEGTVERSGDRVHVIVRLDQVSPEGQLWSNQYNRDIRDLLRLQDEIARAVMKSKSN